MFSQDSDLSYWLLTLLFRTDINYLKNEAVKKIADDVVKFNRQKYSTAKNDFERHESI
jgi:hypothetical protein